MTQVMLTGIGDLEAARAFSRASRAARRAAFLRRVRRRCSACARLAVYDALGPRRRQGARGIQEIPLAQIAGTLEPTRAAQFDHEFRPLAVSRARWQRLWLAQHNGAPLPPISVAPVRGGYAIRDGHHRVSVAAARGATTIDAFVDL